MDRRTPGISLLQAVDGFLKYKVVEGLSSQTLTSYGGHLRVLAEFVGDRPVASLKRQDLTGFFYCLRTDYTQQGICAKDRPLASKTIYNFWVTCKSFAAWLHDQEFTAKNIMKGVPRPKYTEKTIRPFSKEDVQALLGVCHYARVAQTNGRREYKMERHAFCRDHAMTLFLLDSGLRAAKLCALTIGCVDAQTGEVTDRHGPDGGAKGSKGRTVHIGRGTRRALWRYLIEREDKENPDAPLFVGTGHRPFYRDGLRLLFRRLGGKSGLQRCTPHMFRHTFAINYLRSGGRCTHATGTPGPRQPGHGQALRPRGPDRSTPNA